MVSVDEVASADTRCMPQDSRDWKIMLAALMRTRKRSECGVDTSKILQAQPPFSYSVFMRDRDDEEPIMLG